MNKTISILGCGWLGKALGRSLVEKEFSVKGSVVKSDKKKGLENARIEPYLVNGKVDDVFAEDMEFFKTDILIISIPPKRNNSVEIVYPTQFKNLIPFIEESGIKKVLFISSTSVYPELNATVSEKDSINPSKASGRALLKVEQMLKQNESFQTTILRFGGLIGADRNPARFLHKKTNVFANASINLIHRDDCVGIIEEIISKDCWGELFNACCPKHPTKKEFYEYASEISGLPTPLFIEGTGRYKIVDSQKLIRKLDYKFKYQSPLDYLTELEQERVSNNQLSNDL